MQQQNQMYSQQQSPQMQQQNPMYSQQQNPMYSQQQSPQMQQQNPMYSQQQMRQPLFVLPTQNINDYLWNDSNVEVKKNQNGIFFGYDESLFINPKFYYKYSYLNQNFFVLKNNNGTLTINNTTIIYIPVYDILSLYNFVKSDTSNTSNINLKRKLEERINVIKQNISKTGQMFNLLDRTNFKKENRSTLTGTTIPNYDKFENLKYKNFGKVKKRQLTKKTYIFFGSRTRKATNRSILPSFLYVCFREDNNVFYYEQNNLNKKIPLSAFTNIDALEDLISFILLRRMIIPEERDFAQIILQQAQFVINKLKSNNIFRKKQEMQVSTQSPSNNTQIFITSQLPISVKPTNNPLIIK